MDIDSLRQMTHEARKIFLMCSLKAAVIFRTSQNLSRKIGGFKDVNRNADMIAMNRHYDM